MHPTHVWNVEVQGHLQKDKSFGQRKIDRDRDRERMRERGRERE